MYLYLDPFPGILIAAAGIFWLSRVLRREESEEGP